MLGALKATRYATFLLIAFPLIRLNPAALSYPGGTAMLKKEILANHSASDFADASEVIHAAKLD